jgi:murein DD-endopeptidase MepM/ murein hydrolase activator NlpD
MPVPIEDLVYAEGEVIPPATAEPVPVQPVAEAAPPPPPPPPPPAPVAAPTDVGGRPADAYETAPAPVYEPAPPPVEGPVTQAANAVGTVLQENVATPIAEAIPEPIKEAAGPPLSGAGGAVGQVGADLAAIGDAAVRLDPGGALTGALQVASRPYEAAVERQGRAAAEGEPLVPSPGDILADPSKIIDVLPGAINTSGLGAALQGEQSLDDYVAEDPARAEALVREGGGTALYEDWLASGGIVRTPPGVDNPTDDEIYGGSPGDVLGQVGGELGDFGGSVKDSTLSGAIGPFARGMAIDLFNDPLLPAQLALSLITGGGSLAAPALEQAGRPLLASVARRGSKLGQAANTSIDVVSLDPTAAIGAVAPTRTGLAAPKRATDLTTEGLGQQQTQNIVDITTGYLQAGNAAPATPSPTTPSPVVPAPPATPGVAQTLPPPPNGRLVPSPNIGQRGGAAPSLPGLAPPASYAPSPPTTPTLPSSRYAPVAPGGITRTRPVPGAKRLRPVAPTTGRPLIPAGSRPEIEAPMRKHLDKMGLTDVGVQLVNNIRDLTPEASDLDQAVYRRSEKLIYIALDATKKVELPRVLDHEAVHAINSMGLFRGNEFDTLVSAADQMGLRQRIEPYYRDLAPAQLNEELVAELYTRFRAGETVPEPARTLLQRIGDFLLRLGRASREALPTDILKRIESGEVGRRTRQQLDAAGDAFSRYRGTAFHGSPSPGIERLSANASPEQRMHRNSSTALGAFLTPNRDTAVSYSGEFGGYSYRDGRMQPGTVYSARLNLRNAYDMTATEFDARFLQRRPEAFDEAAAFRADLEAQGYDGIAVWDRETVPRVGPGGIPLAGRQDIREVISFNDVPVNPDDAFRRAGAGQAQTPDPYKGIGLLTGEARLAALSAPLESRQGYNGMDAGPDVNRASHLTSIPVHFRDGTRVVDRPLGEIIDQTYNDLTELAQMAADPTILKNAQAAKYHAKLQKKFTNPDYPTDFATLHGPDPTGTIEKRKATLVGVTVDDAVKRAAPKAAKSTTPSVLNAAIEWSRIRSQLGLFNYANVARYALQNIIGNTVKLALVKPSTVPPMLRKLSDFKGGYRSIRGVAFDEWDDIERDATMGSVGTVRQMDKAQLGTLAKGQLPKPRSALEAGARKFMHPATTAAAQLGDYAERVAIAIRSTDEGFHALNTALPHIIGDHIGRANPPLPYTNREIIGVVKDFLDPWRTRIDSNTGKPRTTIIGTIRKSEPIWPTDKFRTHLQTELRAINPNVDDRAFNTAINDIITEVAASKRVINNYVSSEVDRIAFGFLPTNISEAARLVFLYPYWITKASALYAKTAVTHPVMISTYSRMMEEMETQLSVMDGAEWMHGFFRLMNSPLGMSVWYSPLDLLTTFLTFADWQKEAGVELGDPSDLGKLRGKLPLQLSPIVDLPLYLGGFYGDIGTNIPDPIGLNRFASLASQLLNLANAHGMLPAGVGKDALGNPVPITTKPLQQLTATVGHEVSTLLRGITGQEPIPIPALMGTQQRDIRLITEQNVRRDNPALTQSEVDARVDAIQADPDSPEAREAYQQWADAAFQVAGDFNTPAPDWIDATLQGLARIASPISIQSVSEQLMLDSRMKNMTPSGDTPERVANVDDPSTPNYNESGDTSRQAASETPELRAFRTEVQGYWDIYNDTSVGGATWQIYNQIAHAGETSEEYGTTILEQPIEVAGHTYTHEELAAMEYWDRNDIADLYALDHGTDKSALRDASHAARGTTDADGNHVNGATDEYLAAHADVAAYLDFNRQKNDPNAEALMHQQMATNPAYAEHMAESPPYDPETGDFVASWAFDEDAYLASQGIRPSVFTRQDAVPIVAEPGYVPPSVGPPVSPSAAAPVITVTPTDALNLRTEPGGVSDVVGIIDPGVPLEELERQPGWVKVRAPDGDEGWVTDEFVEAGPATGPAAAPTANGAGPLDALGGIVEAGKNALGAVVGTMTGWAGNPTKPAQTSSPGKYAIESAPDGMGVKSTPDSDRTWMENMLGGVAKVTTDYKGPPPAGVSYDYQIGHGADGTTHAAYDIGIEGGGGKGTPVASPVSGTVVCAGYGQGSGGLGGCNYSKKATFSGMAHTIVIEVGTDAAGNPVQMSFNHMGESSVQPGQTIAVGDPIGTIGNTTGGPHIHLEGWLGDPAAGYQIIDPTLIVGGYYTGASPAQSAPSTTPALGTPTLDFLAPVGAALDSGVTATQESQGETPPGDTMGTVENPADHYNSLPTADGDWEVLDQFNDAYLSSSQQVGQEQGIAPPPDLIKAMNAMESGYGRVNPPTGVRNDVRDKPLAGFVGVFKDAADSWGVDFERMTTDPEYAIYGMATGLATIGNWDASQYDPDATGTVYENYGWDGVMAIYYSGQPLLDAPQPADDTTTVRQYVENINAMREQIR